VSDVDSMSDNPQPSADGRADYLVTAGGLNTDDARRLAEVLVTRHARAPAAPGRLSDIETLLRADSIAITSIARDAPELATVELRAAERHQAGQLQEKQDRLFARVAADRIPTFVVSLNLDEIWFEQNGEVRIETHRKGEPGDVCVELAGVSVGLLAAGRVDVAEALIAHYAGFANDFDLYALVNYYEFSTAIARAAASAREFASSRHPEIGEAALATTRRLVAIALASDRLDHHPAFIVAVGGQVASGKSTLARALADRMNVPRVIADRVRDQLLYGTPGREIHESRWVESYEPGFHERVYTDLLQRAEMALASGRAVVLDGCFAKADDRMAARALAHRHRIPFRFIEPRISDETQRNRLEMRDAAGCGNGWKEIARTLASDWEPTTELLEDEICVLDGDRPLDESVAQVLSKLPAWPDPARPGAPVPPLRRPLPHPPAAVTFDCWNTLIYEADWEQAHARRVNALERASREAGGRPTRAEARSAFDAGWAHQMACWREGIKSGAREVAIHALRELGLLEPHPALEHLIREYEEASHSGRVLAVDGARECLADLAQAGVRRALVCDTGLTPGRVVRHHLERLGLLEHLEVCIFSDEVGAPKPDSRVFRAALAPLDVRPEWAIHVGDLRRTDVAGARAVGMGTVRIRTQHDDTSHLPDADSVVDSHVELVSILLRRAMNVAGSPTPEYS
jgi:FMN phosphatase YigB (HAD superfamily)/predicted kinase